MSYREPAPAHDGLRVVDCAFCQGHGKVLGNDVQQFETKRAIEVLKEIAEEYGVTVEDIIGRLRTPLFCEPRDKAAYRLRFEVGLGLKQVGRYLGNRDHSTVLHSIANHRRRIKEEAA
jgi:chromosomal replication initiation ATPase DnaA